MVNKPQKKFILKKSENLSDWYTDIILKVELADYAPVKGCMVIRPYGYALWEKIQEFQNKLIKEKGVKNAYFPLFIPEKFLEKEKEHVEGFAPHMAVVTIAGGEELKEKMVVRPTSETIMYEMYKKWIRSWRDFPVLINQWNNVVRWEKRTYLFLRTSEFLWQEGHCAFLSHEENLENVLWALDMYEKTYNELLGMYGIKGIKSEAEKFAGADRTYTFEMLMPDGKALQACTSHDLGQNFAKAFDWSLQNKNGEKIFPHQNSWGFSTRSIGGLIMTQSDDQGLMLPPNIAPVQIVIIPIGKGENDKNLNEFADKIKKELKDYRVEIDLKEGESVGFKFNKWEVRGVPLRLEIGQRELEENSVTMVRRDNGEKMVVKLNIILSEVGKTLDDMQKQLFLRHQKFTKEHTFVVKSYDEFKKIMQRTKGFLKAFWCGDKGCEAKIKEETKASTRCLPLDAKEEQGKCVYCGKSAKNRWLFAQSY